MDRDLGCGLPKPGVDTLFGDWCAVQGREEYGCGKITEYTPQTWEPARDDGLRGLPFRLSFWPGPITARDFSEAPPATY